MKKSFCAMALLGLAVPLLLSGCVERRVYVATPPPPGPPATDVVVTQAPPPPQTEVVVAAPGPDYVWTPGYWSWQGRWVWIGGAWRGRPHAHAVWIGGRWMHRGRGYIWVGGHWR